MTSRRQFLRTAGIATVLGPAITGTAGAGIPDEIKIVVPYSPGGSTDTLARILAQNVSERAGNAVTVDYRPGAGSMVGIAHVARAPADGSTLVIINSSFVINPILRASTPYRVEDLRPVTQLVDVPFVLLANLRTPFDTVPELVDHYRRTDRAIEFAMPGMGGAAHLGGVLLGRAAGLQVLPIPYKGSPPAHADVIAGRVPLLIETLPTAIPQVQAGRMKMIAALGQERIHGLGQYPTVAETFPGFNASTFYGLAAPAATPGETIDEISNAVTDVLLQQENRDRLEKLGLFVRANGPVAFGTFLTEHAAKWAAIIREQKITVE